jgi:hypothetical protein
MAQTLVIADRSRRNSGWVSIIFGTIFGGFAAMFTAFALTETISWTNDTGALFGLAFGGLVTILGGSMVAFGIRNVWLSHIFGVPTLIIPRGAQLCLGGVLVARFHRQGGTPRARRTPVLSADLVCQERVTYRQGTDNHTVTNQVCRRELAVTTDQIPDTVSGQVFIKVPLGAPPSLALSDNRIIWSVQVRVRVPGVPDDEGSFTVTVLLVVAPEALR